MCEEIKRSLREAKIRFKKHFYDRAEERPISEELVKKYIKKTELIKSIEEQSAKRKNEKKFKVTINMSGKYDLIVIGTIDEKALNIITAWNSNRKWKKWFMRKKKTY